MTEKSDAPAISLQAKLAEYGLKAGPETFESLKLAVADLEVAASNIRGPRSYLQEPIHTLRLWTK